MPQDTFEEIRARNEDAYGLFFDIEVVLRELIAGSLLEAHGPKWAKRGLPPDLQGKVKNAVTYERTVTWHRAVAHHPLYYLDFPDLKKIILNGSNWPTAFAEIFGHNAKAGTEATLSELELLRNKVAHNRLVQDADLAVIRGAWTKLMASIPPDQLANAKAEAGRRLPVAVLLRRVASAFEGALAAIPGGLPLPDHALAAMANTDCWWFDESYLGVPVEPAIEFVALCHAYSEFPRGIGQNYVRQRWSSEKGMSEIGSRAASFLAKVIGTAERSYA